MRPVTHHDAGGAARRGLRSVAGGPGPALAMAGLLWRRLRRDRTSLAFTFALPVAVAAVMVGIYATDHAAVGVVVEGRGDTVGEAVYDRLDRDGLVEVHRYTTRDALERAVRRREVAAGAVVPRGAGHDGGTSEVALLGPPGIEAPSAVRAVVESAVAETAAALAAGRDADPDAPVAEALRAGTAALAAAPRQQVAGTTPEERRQDSAASALVGVLVLFVFVNTVGGAGWLAELRELGVLARARTTPASPGALATGFGLAMASYALVQAGLVLATGRLLFGVSWGSWPALLAVGVAVSVAAAGLAVVVATVLPAAELGTTVAGPVAFVLGMLGGCLWPLELAGPALARVGRLTPHAWAVDALRGVAVSGEGLAAVATEVAVLAAASAVLVAVGARRLRRVASHA